jgi:hypothetical protein
MSTHAFGLNSIYDDLRCRYGENDETVVQLKAELDKQLAEPAAPLVERRSKKSSGKLQSRANWQSKPVSIKDSPRGFWH